jgi:hypothetical protein
VRPHGNTDLPPRMGYEAGDGAYVSAGPRAGFTKCKPRLTALLFRGVRFTPGKVVRKDSTCWNCRGKLKKGTPCMAGRSNKAHYLHNTCAEAIALDGNECVREPETIDG